MEFYFKISDIYSKKLIILPITNFKCPWEYNINNLGSYALGIDIT